ncbi:hypothetical protein RCL1_001902 [Eukaryota sp. TZLM3-RCL]
MGGTGHVYTLNPLHDKELKSMKEEMARYSSMIPPPSLHYSDQPFNEISTAIGVPRPEFDRKRRSVLPFIVCTVVCAVLLVVGVYVLSKTKEEPQVTFAGSVHDLITKEPVSNALVLVYMTSSQTLSTHTNDNGQFSIRFLDGPICFGVSKSGYFLFETCFESLQESYLKFEVFPVPQSTFSVSGTVSDPTEMPLPFVTVTINGRTKNYRTTTDTSGTFTIRVDQDDDFSLVLDAENFYVDVHTFRVDGRDITLNKVLTPKPSLGCVTGRLTGPTPSFRKGMLTLSSLQGNYRQSVALEEPFTFNNLVFGDYMLGFIHELYAFHEQSVSVASTNCLNLDISLTEPSLSPSMVVIAKQILRNLDRVDFYEADPFNETLQVHRVRSYVANLVGNVASFVVERTSTGNFFVILSHSDVPLYKDVVLLTN